MSLESAVEGLFNQTQASKDALQAAIGMEKIDVTLTLAQINAGTAVVAAKAGESFCPVDVWMQTPGSDIAAATLVRLVEETSSNVVISHVIADLASSAWAAKAGGTVVTTYLGKVMAAGKALLADKTGTTATGANGGVRFIVFGFWV